jgi:flagellar basal-body rod protein FlgB
MTDALFADNAARAAKLALNGLSLRQQVISRNLANVDTPGYQAQTVNFEDTLKRALNESPTLAMKVTDDFHQVSSAESPGFTSKLRPGGTERADQNNVDVDVEMIDMSETGIQYQAVSQSLSQKLLLLKNLAR